MKMRLVLILLVGCGVSGCDSPHKSATLPVLQRYQSLQPVLSAAAASSAAVSRATSILQRAVAAGNVSAVRIDAVHLKSAALVMEARDGRAAAAVRPLEMAEPNLQLHRYLHLIDTGLAHMWAEALALVSVSDLTWSDPHLLLSTDVQRLGHASAIAQRQDRLAMAAARSAAALKGRYRRLFRYIPVHPTSTAKGT